MVHVIEGDALTKLREMDSETVNCIVTSPPYYQLRDFKTPGQIGLEKMPEVYVERLTEVFREARRVLRSDGTMWLNIGDSYAGSKKGAAHYPYNAAKYKQGTSKGMLGEKTLGALTPDGCKPKDLIGIPWMTAFALRADGWYLRQDIIWHKPNVMPESVRDRCTNNYEHIFLLAKSRAYYFNGEAIAEKIAPSTEIRMSQNIEQQGGSAKANGGTRIMKAEPPRYGGKKYTETPDEFYRTKSGNAYEYRDRRNKRAVWTIANAHFNGAHFATFPIELAENCILAGCPEGGRVLDMFAGSGTTGEAALNLGRDAVLIEINPKYAEMARKRTAQVSVYDCLTAGGRTT